jgi:phage repressor protein C with HTH and peptisase S24 domain
MSSNKVHPIRGDRYRERRSATQVIERIKGALGLRTQSALAEILGVRRAAVSDAKRQDRIPSEWLLKLCRSHGLNPYWVETEQGAKFVSGDRVRDREAGYGDSFEYIPMVEARLAGGGGSLETSDRVLGYYAFRREWLAGKGSLESMRLMRVTGESMEPTIEDNDVVMVDFSQADVMAGKIYAVRIDDEIVVKRLERKPGRLVFVSDNRKNYEPLEIDLAEYSNVEVLGRVVWMARELA